jgi:hypothetical protein
MRSWWKTETTARRQSGFDGGRGLAVQNELNQWQKVMSNLFHIQTFEAPMGAVIGMLERWRRFFSRCVIAARGSDHAGGKRCRMPHIPSQAVVIPRGQAPRRCDGTLSGTIPGYGLHHLGHYFCIALAAPALRRTPYCKSRAGSPRANHGMRRVTA